MLSRHAKRVGIVVVEQIGRSSGSLIILSEVGGSNLI